ncbi:MAG TPA: tetratricopeptide repeat protein [Silvibacterium sp.]|nr:tetratricopeptide repeat protein [Silvibacterium sp.]
MFLPHLLLTTTLAACLFAAPCSAAQEAAQVSSVPSSAVDLAAIQKLIDRGQAKQALAQLDAAEAQQPAMPGIERLKGMAFYAEGDYTEADQALAKALQQDPKDIEAAEYRGLTLFRLGKPAAAIPVLEAIHEWAPGTKVDPSYVLALCYLDTRRYDDARHAFARQFGFPPDSAAAYLLAGRMLLRHEFLPVAQEYAKKAVELNPRLPLSHQLLGEIALAKQDVDEAIAEFEKERDLNPLYGGIYDRLGDAYTRTGQYQKALQALQQAVLLEPNSTGPYILLGKVTLKLQDPVSAAGYLERAEKMDPGNYMTHGLLSQAYRVLGKTADASREAETAEKLQSAADPRLETPR